jgi:hypothetical protein
MSTEIEIFSKISITQILISLFLIAPASKVTLSLRFLFDGKH